MHTSRGSRHSSVASDQQSLSPSRRQRNIESLQQQRHTDHRRRTSPLPKQKFSPKADKRTRSSSSSSNEEQQNVSKNDDYLKLSKQKSRGSAERQTTATERRSSRNADKRRRTTPDRRGNVSPERRQRSTHGRRSGVSSDRRHRPSTEKCQRNRSPDQHSARLGPEHKHQVHARSRSNSSLSRKPPVRKQPADQLQRESDRMDRQRASNPTNAGTPHVRKSSSSSPEPVKAIRAANQQQPTLESDRINQSVKASGMAAEHNQTCRISRSKSDDADVKKRKELSGNEEVPLWF